MKTFENVFSLKSSQFVGDEMRWHRLICFVRARLRSSTSLHLLQCKNQLEIQMFAQMFLTFGQKFQREKGICVEVIIIILFTIASFVTFIMYYVD